ncbi:MAG: YfhO family protein [Candidatus Amulumruptor caecigallinarius]|nr:YfhO family protein [Candidatus Amulumruptor caecigallinarius]MCM1396481.1 YfhO family protein [Candidatus Amulumruptor caecigallinarius]MCM1453462.1 YfhO family protein [bacterium]
MTLNLRNSRLVAFIGCILVMAAIAFAYFYPDAPKGNILMQHDTQQGIAIGQEAKAFAEQTGEATRWTNSLFSGMPTFQIAPSYPSSKLYEWVNTVMGLGLPSPANLVFMMMAGMFILLMAMRMRWYVALAGAIAYGFSSYFIIIIGAGHIWKFVTLAYIPPTFAGIVLCYQGRYLAGGALAALFAMMQIASNHVQMSYYFLFVVAGFVVVYLVQALRPSGDSAKAVVRGKHALARWGIATGVLIVAGGLAVLANLPSLYNTYEYSKETMRGRHSELSAPAGSAQDANSSAGLDRDYITQYSYGQMETFSLLIPDIKGGASAKPEKGSTKMMTLANLPDVQQMVASGDLDKMEAQYLEYLTQYFGEPEGTNGPVYVGALICAFFLLGMMIVRGPWKWMLLVLTIFSIFLAWGRNFMWFTNLMIDYMPMYAKFRTVESILVIAEFTMPLLGAMALQKLVTAGADDLKRYEASVIWSFAGTAFFCLLAIIFPGIYGDAITAGDMQTDTYISQALAAQGYSAREASMFSLQNPHIYQAVESLRYGMVRADAFRSLIFLVLGFVVVWLFVKRKLSAAVCGIAIAALVLVDLYTVNKRYLDHESFMPKPLTAGAPIPITDVDRAILADTAMNYRVMDIPRFYQAAPSYYHKAIGGYHAAKLTRYQDLIERHLANFTSGNPSEADWQVLDMLNARYVVGPDGTPAINDRAMGNAWFVDSIAWVNTPDEEMAGLSTYDLRRVAVVDRKFAPSLPGQASAPVLGDTIFETSYAPNRLTYHTSSERGALAVLSEVYFPWGWKAEIDGSPVEIARANYVLRAIPVPAGSHTLTLTFDPVSLHTTDTVASVAIVIIYVALLCALALAIARYIGRRKLSNQR